MSDTTHSRRMRIGRAWRLALQAIIPGFLLHEAAHWLAAHVVADGGRLMRAPSGRAQVVTAWAGGEQDVWRRVVVAFAPFGFALVALPGVAVVVGGAVSGGGMRALVACWGWGNLLALGGLSLSDLRLAAGDITDTEIDSND